MLSQDLNIPDSALHEDYLSKIKGTCFTCSHCHKCPFISINKQQPDSIDISCECSKKCTMKIKEYFQLPWLENEIASNNNSKYNSNDEKSIIAKTNLILDVLSIWNSIIKSTNTLKAIFNFNVTIKCTYLDHFNEIKLIEYVCEDCVQTLCEKCYKESEHHSHNVIKLNEHTDKDNLNQNKLYIADALNIMEQNNENELNDINNIISSKMSNTTNNDLISLKHQLLLAICENKIINKCFHILFLILTKLYETYNNNNNNPCLLYSLLKSIKNFSNIYIPSPNSFNTNPITSSIITDELQSHINNVITHLSTTYILTHDKQESFFENLQSHYNKYAFKCSQISLRCGVSYSHNKNKKNEIKQILLLNNFDFALATSSKSIKIFEPETMKCIQKCSNHTAQVNYLCPLGMRYFLSCSDDGSVIQWKHHRSAFTKISSHFQKGKKMIKHLDKIHFVIAYDNEKKAIILESDNNIKVYQINDNQQPFTLLKTFKQDSPQITSMLVYKDNTLITLTNDDNAIRFWNINEARLDVDKTISELDTVDKINSMKLLNNKMLIVAGNSSFVVINLYDNCILWRVNGDDICQVNAVDKINEMNFIIAAKQYFIVYRVLVDKIEETKKVSHSQFGNISDLCVMNGNNIIISSTTESSLNKFTYEIQ